MLGGEAAAGQGALRIVVIGAMTPLADALAADKEGLLKGVGGVFLQGHPEVFGCAVTAVTADHRVESCVGCGKDGHVAPSK